MTERELRRIRTRRCRLEDPTIRTEREALDFIDEMGLCAEFSHKALPTFYDAVHSDELPDEKGWNWDKIDRAWHLALRLARKKKIYYGKFFAGNTLLMSLNALPAFLGLYAPADYLEEYLSGRLSRLGKDLMDVLTEFGIQSSEDLRARLSLKGKEGNALFKKALAELQSRGLLSAVGAVKRGRSGWDVLLWEPIERWIPEPVARARNQYDSEDALLEVLEIVLNSLVFGSLDDIRRTLKRKKDEVRGSLAHLVATGRIGVLERKGKEDLYHMGLKGES
jgi:hypothetical protein